MNIPLTILSTLRHGQGHVSSSLSAWNREAVLAWHRAQGSGITLIRSELDPSIPAAASDWVAVIDDELTGDAAQSTPSTSLAQLRALHGVSLRAVEHRPAYIPGMALVDRDGTTIVDRQYLSDPAGVELLPGAAEGLRLLQEAGVRLALATNQSGVARGWIAPLALTAIHQRLTLLLAQQAVALDGIYICPHLDADDCPCRKPRTGLAEQAATDLGVELSSAIVVGDKVADVGLAQALGVPAFLVLTGEGVTTLSSSGQRPDYVVDDLAMMARICLHPAGLLSPVSLPD